VNILLCGHGWRVLVVFVGDFYYFFVSLLGLFLIFESSFSQRYSGLVGLVGSGRGRVGRAMSNYKSDEDY
jgi:hypothetical protein